MSTRKPSDASDSISLFPFLAVLLCTMGALLVLLVVLVDRAAQKAALATQQPVEQALAEAPLDDGEAKALEQELTQLASYQAKLDKLRAEGEERLKKHRERLVQVEASARSLEQELAKLSIAAMQLEQAGKEREVDQRQADAEAARLEKLVKETVQQLDELRQEGEVRKSYAIVPYKGVNGTFRKPIYIECDKNGVTIQPEGLRLTDSDFAAVSWPGNPLASVLRATREHLNARALNAGQTQPPDPYPLLIVRPSGIEQYAAARAAITAWDTDYGYEFMEEDTHLTYRDMPDPLLQQAQEHALMVSRDRLVQMAQAAPRRFRGVSIGGSTLGDSAASSSAHGGGMFGSGDGTSGGTSLEGSSPYGDLVQNGTPSDSSANGSGTALSGGAGNAKDTSLGNLNQGGGLGDRYTGMSVPSETASPTDQGFGRMQERLANSEGGANGVADGTPAGGSPANATAGDSTGPATGPMSDASSAGSGGATGAKLAAAQAGGQGASGSNSGSAGGLQLQSKSQIQSIAATQGVNWAVQNSSRHQIPIQRTIAVSVRPQEVVFLPETYNLSRATERGKVVSLAQSPEKIAQEFSDAFQARIEQWGIAGNGMFWKPVLEVTVSPNAVETAAELRLLLENSGVELQEREPITRTASEPGQQGILR